MSTEPDRGQYQESVTADPFDTDWAWKGGGLAGLIATIVMGVAISVMDLATLRLAIAGLYGQAGNLVVGWIAHLAHGTLFGMIFAFLLMNPGLYRVTNWVWKSILAGVVYGLVLAIAGAGIIMPIWLGVVGFPTPPRIPYVTASMLIWHTLYGVVLGGLFSFVDDF